jgi:very-short-patch-repair endonuclease
MSRELPQDCRELAYFQRGVLSRTQALQSGLGSGTVSAQLRAGRWQRLHRGVYATFTGEPGRETLLWAALRRAGPEAVLSHHTAAELTQLAPRPTPLIHVTVPRQMHLRPIPGVILHRSSRIDQARHPTLTPPQTRLEETTLDLAEAAGGLDDALAWLARACGARLTRPDLLRTTIEQRARMRWRHELIVALDDISGGAHSVLELRHVRWVERAHGLPRAQRQVRVVTGARTGYRDALYADFGLVVETDGRAAHPAEQRWRDQHRDNAVVIGGAGTLRYSWTDVSQRPCHVAAEIAAALRKRGWLGSPRRCGPACPVRSDAARASR